MKVIFLDYDGVVNTPIWDDRGNIDHNYPSDGKVNNYQAIMWLNHLIWRTNAKIVVSSTWRYCCNDTSYQDCLYNAGLSKEIEIIGCTKWFGSETRTEEIKKYLKLRKAENEEKENNDLVEEIYKDILKNIDEDNTNG